MAAAVFAAASVIGSELVFGAGVAGLTSTLFAKAAFSAGIALVSESLQEAPQAASASPMSTEIAARKQLVRTSAAARRVILGEVGRVSGNLVYVANGTDANYVHFVIVLATHRCHAINDCRLGDDLVGALDAGGNCIEGRFAGFVRIRKYLGTDDQVMDPDLAAECPEWAEKARPGKGICYVYLRLKRNRSVFPQGIPTPRFDVEGKADVLDIRTMTTGYTRNAALLTLDWILWRRGFASGLDEIVTDTWVAAANVADEDVALPAAAGGGTQKRYQINGSFTLDRGRAEVLDQMRQAMAGAVNYTMGRWFGHAGAAATPVMDLSEADLRGPYRIRPRVSDDRVYNAVKGTYTETAQWTETDFPAITNATYEAQDGGQRITKDVRLPFETDPYRAQRLAKIDLERHRQGVAVDLPLKIKGIRLQYWSVVRLSLTHPGFVNKLFRVVDWKFNLFAGPDVVLEEYADAIYTWSSLEATLVDPAPDTTLPNPLDVEAPGAPVVVEEKYETTGSAGVKSRAIASWTPPADPSAREFSLEYRPIGGEFTSTAWREDARVSIDDLAPGRYEFRVRSRNSLGVPSGYGPTTTAELRGLTDAPENVTGFSVAAFNGAATGTWSLTPDLDVKIGGRMVIRWTPITSGAVWENGIDVAEFNGDAVTGAVPMFTGTYFAKFRDSTGNWSASAASFVLTAGTLTSLGNSMAITESPNFPGTKSNVAAVDATLKLDGSALIDDVTDLVDSWSYIDTLGGISPAGSYTFSNGMDFGSVVTRRVTASIQALAFDTGDEIDSRGMVDDWDSVDGNVINDATATLMAATSQDGVSYGAWFPLMAGDVTCRAIKFRLDLASAQPTHNIAVSTLSVTAQW